MRCAAMFDLSPQRGDVERTLGHSRAPRRQGATRSGVRCGARWEEEMGTNDVWYVGPARTRDAS